MPSSQISLDRAYLTAIWLETLFYGFYRLIEGFIVLKDPIVFFSDVSIPANVAKVTIHTVNSILGDSIMAIVPTMIIVMTSLDLTSAALDSEEQRTTRHRTIESRPHFAAAGRGTDTFSSIVSSFPDPEDRVREQATDIYLGLNQKESAKVAI
ncbi:hypothetical protein HHX47_DHR3000579 [Lentinula edodes]|nr:hypothetical protein HHX47_DHR3000579 [Lentinula edodes]